MKKSLAVLMAVGFILGCGSSGGGSDDYTISAQDAHDNMCLDMGCSHGCEIYTDADPDGAGTITWCQDDPLDPDLEPTSEEE
jgi:hypothetical protein